MAKKKSKKKMGRPPLKNPRGVLVALRLTASEKRRLVKAAKAAGTSLSAYLMAPHRKGR